jgi:Na+/H+-dicarboxylate symporter
VQLAPTQLVIIALTAILTTFSVPGVPHGCLLVISPLVVTMGIPAARIGLLIATFLTTVNVTADMTAAVLVSRARVTAEAEKLPDVTGATTT